MASSADGRRIAHGRLHYYSMATNDGFLQRVEQETVMANAFENMNRTGDRCNGKSTAVEGRRAHEVGNLMQQITKETLRATEAWTIGRHAVDDEYVNRTLSWKWY